MVSIRAFSMILGTLLCRELATSDAADSSYGAILPIVAYCLSFGLLAKCSALFVSLSLVGEANSSSGDPIARFSRYRRIIEMGWILLLPIGLTATGWGPTLKSAEALGLLPSVALALWFAPSLALVLGLDLISSQLELHLDEQILADRSHEVLAGTSAEKPGELNTATLFERLSVRLRLGETGGIVVCMFPVLTIVACSDFLGSIGSNIPVLNRAILSLGAMIVIAACLLPWWMSRWMGAEALPHGFLHSRIADLCGAAGIGKLDVKWINSQNRWSGAAVVGWLPQNRQLWLGDGLFEHLNSLELDMVILHELSHVRRRHFLWRFLPIGLAIAVGGGIAAALGLVTDTTFAGTVGLVAGLVFTLVGMGWSSHRCELDADVQACILASRGCSWASDRPEHAAAALISALKNLLSDSSEASQTSWLHPSLSTRRTNLLAFAAGKQQLHQKHAVCNTPSL